MTRSAWFKMERSSSSSRELCGGSSVSSRGCDAAHAPGGDMTTSWSLERASKGRGC